MENIIKKLENLEEDEYGNKNIWANWSKEELHELLKIYFTISKKEHHIFKLIYSYHETDCYEDIFRDYDEQYFIDKSDGVEIAINTINGIGEDYYEDDADDEHYENDENDENTK